MRVGFSQLKKMKVVTAGGDILGYVYDLVIDANSHGIIQYKVKSSGLRTREYLIHRAQVRRIKEDKIMVDDNVVKEARKIAKKASAGAEAEPVAMRKATE